MASSTEQEMVKSTSGKYTVPLSSACTLAYVTNRLEYFRQKESSGLERVRLVGMKTRIPEVGVLVEDTSSPGRVYFDFEAKCLWMRVMSLEQDYMSPESYWFKDLEKNEFFVNKKTWQEAIELIEGEMMSGAVNVVMSDRATFWLDGEMVLPHHVAQTTKYVGGVGIEGVNGVLVVPGDIDRGSDSSVLENDPKIPKWCNLGLYKVKGRADRGADIKDGVYLVASCIAEHFMSSVNRVFMCVYTD